MFFDFLFKHLNHNKKPPPSFKSGVSSAEQLGLQYQFIILQSVDETFLIQFTKEILAGERDWLIHLLRQDEDLLSVQKIQVQSQNITGGMIEISYEHKNLEEELSAKEKVSEKVRSALRALGSYRESSSSSDNFIPGPPTIEDPTLRK